jgi:hypothetical protein
MDEENEVRKGNRSHVEKGGHEESTGKGPHTMAEPKGRLRGTHGAAGLRADMEDDVTEHVSREAREPHRGMTGGEPGAGDAAAPSGTRRAEGRHIKASEDEQLGERTVKGGREIKKGSVEADHVIGEGGRVGTKSAEGMSDMASAQANRKEAMEPEREMSEKAAMGRERSVPTKNVMGHGERETIAKHTI